MWHLDIPKTRQYDHGKVEVLAKNSLGEAYACTQLVVKNRHDDYRALLKNSPRRKGSFFSLVFMLLLWGSLEVMYYSRVFFYVFFRDVSLCVLLCVRLSRICFVVWLYFGGGGVNINSVVRPRVEDLPGYQVWV